MAKSEGTYTVSLDFSDVNKEIDRLVERLDGVLNATRVYLCKTHISMRWGDSDICEALAGGLQSASPCGFVFVAVLEVSE